MNKPLIGITLTEKKVTLNFLGKQPYAFLNARFIKLIKDIGGVPVMLPVVSDKQSIANIVERLDGIFLTSGEDVHPASYNEDLLVKYSDQCTGIGEPFLRSKSMEPNRSRDEFEIELYHQAKKNNLPILGICRGMQMINVAEGGTLHQEIPETDILHSLADNHWIHYHNIQIDPGSRSADLMGTEQYVVSSMHHQAVKDLGNNLIASAKSADDIVEIIEGTGNQFIIGIQGHPEQNLKNFPLMNNIFKQFIRAAQSKEYKNININNIEVENVGKLS